MNRHLLPDDFYIDFRRRNGDGQLARKIVRIFLGMGILCHGNRDSLAEFERSFFSERGTSLDSYIWNISGSYFSGNGTAHSINEFTPEYILKIAGQTPDGFETINTDDEVFKEVLKDIVDNIHEFTSCDDAQKNPSAYPQGYTTKFYEIMSILTEENLLELIKSKTNK